MSAWVNFSVPEIIHVLSEGDGWAGEVCKAVDYFVRSTGGATLDRFLERTNTGQQDGHQLEQE